MSSLDPVILSEVKKIQKAQSNVTPGAGAWPVDKIDVILSSQSYTVPETGTYRVLVVGGGGSGGRWSTGKATGGGAGGFRYAEVALTVGQILTATIGAGGASVPVGNVAGVSGGQSRLQLVDTGMDMIANGGSGGNAAIANKATLTGGVGGTATGSSGSTLVGRDVSNTGGSGGNKTGDSTGKQSTGGGGVNYYGRPTNGGNSTVTGTTATYTGGGGVGGRASDNATAGGGAGGVSIHAPAWGAT